MHQVINNSRHQKGIVATSGVRRKTPRGWQSFVTIVWRQNQL